jgi:uncharacterized membrane protein YccC
MPAEPRAATYWRGIVRLETAKIAPWTGLRNALGVVLALAAGSIFRNTAGGMVVAIGALNTGYSDGQDSYRQRVRRMSATAILCGLAVCTGGFVSAHHAGAIVLSALFASGAGMLVALGTAAADVGLITLVTFLVFSAQVMSPEKAVLSGLMALSGGMVQAAIALALLRVDRYRQERQALAELYRELARAAGAPAPATEAPPAGAQSTRAQQIIGALAQDGSLEAERYLALLSQTERIRLTLLALARLRARLARQQIAETAVLDRAFVQAAAQLTALADLLGSGSAARNIDPPERDALGETPSLANPSLTEEGRALILDVRRNLDAWAGQFRAAWELANHAAPSGLAEFARSEARRPWWLRLRGALAILRANFDGRSPVFRHALRLAGCVTLGIALGRAFDLQRSYWIPMTVALVLKPDFNSTLSRGVQRIGGTLAGLVLATVLFHVLAPDAALLVALVGLFVFLLRCFGPANYGIFAAAVSALIVLLFAATGVAPQTVIAARAWNTLAGGAIALVAYAAWPTWERTQFREVLARLIDAHRHYFQLVRDAYVDPADSNARDRDRARLNGRLARSNMEASLDRLRTEPSAGATAAALTSLLANSHRFIHAVMALDAGLASNPARPRPEFRAFTNQVDLTLYLLAAALRGSEISAKDLPALREAYNALIRSGDSSLDRYALVNTETDRITNSLNTLAEEVLRLAAAGPEN